MFCADDLIYWVKKYQKKHRNFLVASKDVGLEENVEKITYTGGIPDGNSSGKFISCNKLL
jgi:hypothetical protein